MGTPLVKAEQDRFIRVEDLTEVVMSGSRLRQARSDWYHLKLPGTSLTPMIVHVRFIAFSPVGLTTQAQRPGPRDAWFASRARWPGSLRRMVSFHRMKWRCIPV